MILLRLVGVVIGFFVIRYLGTAVVGYSESTSTLVAGVVAGLNLVLLLLTLFLPKTETPPAETKDQQS